MMKGGEKKKKVLYTIFEMFFVMGLMWKGDLASVNSRPLRSSACSLFFLFVLAIKLFL